MVLIWLHSRAAGNNAQLAARSVSSDYAVLIKTWNLTFSFIPLPSPSFFSVADNNNTTATTTANNNMNLALTASLPCGAWCVDARVGWLDWLGCVAAFSSLGLY